MTSGSNLSDATKELIRRLRRGQRWLTENHRDWFGGAELDDAEFSTSLMGWGELEVRLRQTGYTDCIWGKGKCLDDAPVRCDACCPTTRVIDRSTQEGYLRSFAGTKADMDRRDAICNPRS